jgi:cell division protein FtsB
VKPLLIIPALFAAALLYITADQGSGLLTWMRHREDLVDSDARITDLEIEIARLKQEIEQLQSDPFAIESAIREDLHLARAQETVIRMPGSPGLNPRFP